MGGGGAQRGDSVRRLRAIRRGRGSAAICPPLIRRAFDASAAQSARAGCATPASGTRRSGQPQVLADWRMRRGLFSANKLLAAAGTWRVYREVAGLGRGMAAWRLGQNLARGALKRVGG